MDLFDIKAIRRNAILISSIIIVCIVAGVSVPSEIAILETKIPVSRPETLPLLVWLASVVLYIRYRQYCAQDADGNRLRQSRSDLRISFDTMTLRYPRSLGSFKNNEQLLRVVEGSGVHLTGKVVYSTEYGRQGDVVYAILDSNSVSFLVQPTIGVHFMIGDTGEGTATPVTNDHKLPLPQSALLLLHRIENAARSPGFVDRWLADMLFWMSVLAVAYL